MLSKQYAPGNVLGGHQAIDTMQCSQVPFFATSETKRKRGYGRALVEAIEEVSKFSVMVDYCHTMFHLSLQPFLPWSPCSIACNTSDMHNA